MADDILSIELDESRSLLHRIRKCHFLSAEFQINLDKGAPLPMKRALTSHDAHVICSAGFVGFCFQ